MICSVLRSGALAALFLALSSPVSAQLERAEQAFADVDLEGTRDAARTALEAGGLSRDDVVRALRLLGLSHAALGENRAAYDSFVRMLALDPEASLERSIAPQLRGPYLEARGYWNARSGPRFEVELVAGPSAIVARVRDPLGIARTLKLRARVETTAAYRDREAPASPEVAFEVDGYEGYAEAVLVALDEHGNAVATLGSEAVPTELGRLRERSAGSSNATSSEPRVGRILGGVALGLAAASVGLGAGFHARRQSLASDWNGDACERPIGATRAEQCGEVRDDLDRAQTLSIVGYALAGALAATGIVLFAVGGGSDDEPTTARVACGVSGVAVRCDGRF
jgi:hypothetical protein